jgi:D-sedoheptulose 7-phosphate isomerase
VSPALAADGLVRRLEHLTAAREEAGEVFFAAEGERIARLCHAMAERFAAGGRLLACGTSPAGRSDARHVAVEFVHPVIVGKRALPALALTGDGAPLALELDLLSRAGDMVIVFDAGDRAAHGLAAARGCLTIGFANGGAEWAFSAPGEDPFIAQEIVETTYHMLWEHVHVFFEHRGLLSGRDAEPVHDAGASSFLYPFLAEAEDDIHAVLADVRGSVAMKAAEIGALRTQTLTDNRDALVAAAVSLREALDARGTVLTMGNGGSATDAADAVADLRSPPRDWPARAAIDLAEDPSILTALANDVGPGVLFQRQVIAHGRTGDVALSFSTSGNSENVIAALVEARRRGMRTVAFAGYGGGRIAAEGLADHVVVTASQHIPRIQEAQASAWHALRELVEFV